MNTAEMLFLKKRNVVRFYKIEHFVKKDSILSDELQQKWVNFGTEIWLVREY